MVTMSPRGRGKFRPISFAYGSVMTVPSRLRNRKHACPNQSISKHPSSASDHGCPNAATIIAESVRNAKRGKAICLTSLLYTDTNPLGSLTHFLPVQQWICREKDVARNARQCVGFRAGARVRKAFRHRFDKHTVHRDKPNRPIPFGWFVSLVRCAEQSLTRFYARTDFARRTLTNPSA